MKRLCLLICLLPLSLSTPSYAEPDPLQISGPEQSHLTREFPDGGLPALPGVSNIEIFRCSRDQPQLTDGKGWTYNHHVDMASWHGRLWVGWDNGEKDEDTWPAHEVYSTSADGFHWTPPAELFPLGTSNPLRMYFFHAPSGPMLAIAARRTTHAKVTDATAGGVIVREINPDQSLGPIFTLIPSPAAPGGIPNYQTSSDKQFTKACQDLLANHPYLEQQDYGALLGDQRMSSYQNAAHGFGKAFCFYYRKDGTLVGICKQGWVVQSRDNGATWSPAAQLHDFHSGTAKEWVQSTSGGQFLWAHDPFPTDRFPLVLLNGDDGIHFSNMRVVHGEVPRQRYEGLNKNIGPQYFRGLGLWNDDHSREDHAAWLAYSVNKEDIWISRIPLPIPTNPADGWTTYCPKWADAQWKTDPAGQRDLYLEDHDPYDYARADRLFPKTPHVTVDFNLKVQQPGPRTFEIELWSEFGDVRPVQIVLQPQLKIESAGKPIGDYSPGQWMQFHIDADATSGHFSASVNGKALANNLDLAQKAQDFARIVFRTGAYRSLPIRGNEIPHGTDIPTEPSQYLLRDVTIH